MKTYELLLYPPNSLRLFKCKTAEANSIEEFAEICDRDIFIAQLLSVGWTFAAIRKAL